MEWRDSELFVTSLSSINEVKKTRITRARVTPGRREWDCTVMPNWLVTKIVLVTRASGKTTRSIASRFAGFDIDVSTGGFRNVQWSSQPGTCWTCSELEPRSRKKTEPRNIRAEPSRILLSQSRKIFQPGRNIEPRKFAILTVLQILISWGNNDILSALNGNLLLRVLGHYSYDR